MFNCTTSQAAAAAAVWLLGMAPVAHAATLEMRVDGGFVTGTVVGLGAGETLSFDISGSFADGGSASISLSTDPTAGLAGRLQLSSPALLSATALTRWEQFAVAGVVGSVANGASGSVILSVALAQGPYRTSRLFANGTLLHSVDVLGAAVSPVPEPTAWALMLAGLAGLARCKVKARPCRPQQPG